MAVSQNSVTPTTRLTVSSLLSPPELCSESFSSSLSPSQNIACTTKSTMDSGAKVFGPMNQYASPPFSPDYSLDHKENVAPSSSQQTQGSQHDFALFPADDRRASATSIASDQPLFPSQESESMAREVIEKHMKSSEYARLPVKPSRDEYAVVAAGFQTTWLDQALKNPKAWRAQEREYERQYSEGRYGGRPTGIQKHRSQVPKKLAPAPSSRSRQPKVALPRLPPRSPRAPRAKRSPKARVSNSFSQSPTGASPRPARPVQRDDTNWQILPDYSPPIETLSKGNKILKAEWKGGPLDISNDPNRHLLHEYEFNVAATLRLTCATYLTSKRRVFMGRVEALRKGKEFRKTDAQQACKIDVNKASKLWSAFDRIGWFNPEYFRAYV